MLCFSEMLSSLLAEPPFKSSMGVLRAVRPDGVPQL